MNDNTQKPSKSVQKEHAATPQTKSPTEPEQPTEPGLPTSSDASPASVADAASLIPDSPQAKRFFELSGKLKALAGKLLLDVGDSSVTLERTRRLPRVLVVGEFNAGKSTLINSGLGEVLLPTGVTPTTSLLTSVENGPFAVKVKPIGTKDAIKIEPGKRESAGYGIPDYVFDWQGFRELLTNPEKIEKLERVDISHPAAPREMLILDSPGINDIAKSRAEIVYGVIPSADIVVFVLSATKPFSESERTFLEEKLLAGDLKKIIFVLNRLDEIEESERDEVVAEVSKNVTDALNKAYARVNASIGQTLYLPVETVEVFPCSAKEVTPIHGEARSKTIGFATSGTNSATAKLADGNRRFWTRILEITSRDRQRENDLVFHHFLRRATMRIERTLETLDANRSSDRSTVFRRLSEDAVKLGKLREVLGSAETRIQNAETSLKVQFHQQIDRVIAEIISIHRLGRNPGTVNDRLKGLYEYITVIMKTTLDQLYSELGREFDSVIDDKQFFEERSLDIQYDFSDVPSKIISSMSFAYIAAILFGGTVGMFAGVAYFASMVIANKRSVKQYFLNATVSEESLQETKDHLVASVDREVEYAVDFVRQSLVQRIDTVQADVRNQVYAIQRPLGIDLDEAKSRLAALRTEVNGFLAPLP
ncbi:MAG: dynamin family protein [Candidatus Riflebacteria bacterium]|nr:dynamin family protein [Candidatus Riflebacteria bacterium]